VPAGFTASRRGGAGPPLVLLHGFTDTWRSWELVLPALERERDVLALTLPGHAGGPPLPEPLTAAAVGDVVEAALDDAGLATAAIAGNSLGGYVALELAARGRATSVVALAPAGGWAEGDATFHQTLTYFTDMQELLRTAVVHAESIVSTPEGRRRATASFTESSEHIPPELIVHLMRGAADCPGVGPMIELARRDGWPLEPAAITCPVRFVWGTADRILEWPRAAARYRALFPQAEWVELDGVGHSPQLDVPLETAQLILGHG
jgi:pimeloyl-ACP methyl ester carboxylesterase